MTSSLCGRRYTIEFQPINATINQDASLENRRLRHETCSIKPKQTADVYNPYSYNHIII